MPTLREMTYQVIEGIRAEIVDDDVLDERLIEDLIHGQRALWIRNELNKDRYIPRVLIQEFNCLPLVKADAAECCDFTSDCKVLRTQQRIPRPISLHTKDAITRVGPTILTLKGYSFIPYERAVWFGNGRATQKARAAYMRDGYVFIVSKDPAVNLLKSISVHGVFEDPTEAANINLCTGDACWEDTDEYPITEWLWQYIRAEVQKQMLYKINGTIDKSNDASQEDTRQVQSQKQ